MQPSEEFPASPAILGALRARAGARPALGFEEFMDVALYDPVAGYYRRERPRIGYGPGTDFLTAAASAPVFGRMVAAAAERAWPALQAHAAEMKGFPRARWKLPIGDVLVSGRSRQTPPPQRTSFFSCCDAHASRFEAKSC